MLFDIIILIFAVSLISAFSEEYMKKLLIDIDEVICQSEFLDEMNKFLGTNYSIDDFKEYYIDDILGSDDNKMDFYNIIRNKDLYKNAHIYPGAVETLKDLNRKYQIYICSACVMFCMPEDSGIFFKHKYDFLIKNFPFLNPDNFIFTSAKNIFDADIQIDDRVKNLQGNIKTKLLFTAYHNKSISNEDLNKSNIIRVNSWLDIRKILLDK